MTKTMLKDDCILEFKFLKTTTFFFVGFVIEADVENDEDKVEGRFFIVLSER